MKILPLTSLLLLLFLAPGVFAEESSSLVPADLRCEYEANPQGARSALPHLGWRLPGSARGVHQTGYHILAAGSAEKLSAGTGDLWDSGMVKSHFSQHVRYGGKPLEDGQKVYWKVRLKDQEGKTGGWSEPAEFQVSLKQNPPAPLPLYVAGAPRISSFECSDGNLNTLYEEAARALPEITSLRDTHLSLRAAAYHHNLFPRAKHWLTALNAAIDKNKIYPATLPADGTVGSTQSDAGILAPHILWSMSGDLSLLQDHWTSMNEYIHARKKIDPAYTGRTFGTIPPDTLPPGDPTPPGVIHLASQGLDLRIMAELSRTAAKTPFETPLLQTAHRNLQKSFQEKHLNKKGELKFDSVTGHLITLRYGLLSTPEQKTAVTAQLLKLLEAKKDVPPFSHGPLAATALLPVLTWTDHYEKALALAKAQSPGELSPLALAAISEWLIWMVAGIDTSGPGFQQVLFAPHIPGKDVLSHAKAHYDSSYGRITSHWHYEDDGLVYDISLPPNTSGMVRLPLKEGQKVHEGGKPLDQAKGILRSGRENGQLIVYVLSGSYQFKISQ